MSAFKLKKGEKVRVEIIKPKKDERKTQFNVVIDKKLKDRVKKLSKLCRIPISNFTEHCIEVGMHYIEQTLNDEEKRKILEEHLETKHLLNKKTDDEEYIIRLSENNSNWLILEGVERALNKLQLLTHQVWAAGKEGNLKLMTQNQSDLYREMVTFLKWITELKDYEKYRY